MPCAVESQATSLRTRRGQTLALAIDGGETAFIVREGLFTLQVALPNSAWQVTGIFFPGDLLRSAFAPPQAQTAFIAAGPGEVWRLRASALDALAASEPAVRRYVDTAVASRMARQAIHAVALGQFDLGPAGAMSIIYFLIILFLSWLFYTLMMRGEERA